MAEIAINVLHNIGNVLNTSTSTSSASLKQVDSIKAQKPNKVAEMLELNANNPDFLKDERGKQLAPYLRKLSQQIDAAKPIR